MYLESGLKDECSMFQFSGLSRLSELIAGHVISPFFQHSGLLSLDLFYVKETKKVEFSWTDVITYVGDGPSPLN